MGPKQTCVQILGRKEVDEVTLTVANNDDEGRILSVCIGSGQVLRQGEMFA